MRVFLTGATGFIGAATVPELIKAGHSVLGLTRSDAGAAMLKALGADAHYGSLEDPETLRSGAAKADGVIHCAFDHNFANFAANCAKDARAIAALGDVLTGSNRPLLITSGVGMGDAGDGGLAREDVFNLDHRNPRKASEIEGMNVAARSVNVSVVRLPQVHDTMKQGLISSYIAVARTKGVVAYIGEGRGRWPAAHVSDVARLYVRALERAEPGARYNAVAEEGVMLRDIATVIGTGLKAPVTSITPEDAAAHFGWLAAFVGMDMATSSAQTRQQLGWQPTGPTLLADLARMNYAAGSS